MSRDIQRQNVPWDRVVDLQGTITADPAVIDFYDRLRRVARTDAPILVRGDTGTGKELAARAVHAESRRARGPYRALNCAVLTPELLASELFGHVRGAFTGAVRDRKGLFEIAHGGTLFLDEVGELPLDIQARLLRVLEEPEIVRLGGVQPMRVDVRLVSATHRALRAEVAAGRFREDLMYRIRVVPLFLPRLRDRVGDIDVLTWCFLDRLNQDGGRSVDRIAADAMDALRSYPWPGNVRELRNVLRHAHAVGEGSRLELGDLTPELRGEPPPESDPEPDRWRSGERARILAALRETGGRRGEAARRLGMSRSTLWRKLRQGSAAGGAADGPRGGR